MLWGGLSLEDQFSQEDNHKLDTISPMPLANISPIRYQCNAIANVVFRRISLLILRESKGNVLSWSYLCNSNEMRQ